MDAAFFILPRLIRLKNFVVYKSSAGSGKTFTLVKEFLRLSLYDEKKLTTNYKRILAVTFTNKAATEMKKRVIEALDQLSKNKKESALGNLLCTEIKITKDELQKRAGFVLRQILHHYSDLSIGTIDSFTHKIVKTFAHDLKLPVNFNVELDTAGFYEKVIASLFEQIGEDEYVSKLMKEYALGKAEDNTAWDPEQQIQEFSKLLQKENSGEYIDKLKQFNANELEQFRKQFIDYIEYYRKTLRTEAQKAIALIESEKLSDENFIYKASGPQNFFKKCNALEVSTDEAKGKRIIEAIENNKWANAKDVDSVQKIDKISGQLREIGKWLIDFIQKNFSYYSLCELLNKQMYPLMLLKKIEELSETQKQEERLVFISEFNQKIFDIINNEPTPFIYERLGERYHHYLLDEFQDTSSLQWQNILPLLDNALSNGWFNLVVGDGKQSIYRWRNANVQQFTDLPKIANTLNSSIVEERADTLGRNFKEEILNINYRSAINIVKFNNSFFDPLSHLLLSENRANIYHQHAQETKNTAQGYISIHSGQLERDVYEETTCKTVLAQIKQALAAKFQYKDICILCRFNRDGNTIANFLLEQKIHVISSDSLLLKHNLEINTLISYLKYLINKEDSISAAAVFNYLKQSQHISDADFHLHLMELAKGENLFKIFKKFNIQLNENELSLNNLFDNCVEFIRAMQLNKNAYQYIRFFLDEVNEYLVLKNSSISAFFDWWEVRSRVASMIIPENTDAVKIMTIHASKGLEFPVVIVPFCNWNYYKSNDTWVKVQNEKIKLPVSVVNLSKKASASGFEKELETEQQEQTLDNLNLLYVAFTRAVERLHIISIRPETVKQRNVAEWIDSFLIKNNSMVDENLFEIGTQQTKQAAHTALSYKSFNLEPLSFSTPKEVVKIKASYKMNNDESEDAKRQGLLVHSLLATIKTHEDVEPSLQTAMLRGEINPVEISELREKLAAVCNHSELEPYFKKGISGKLEAELITATGEVLRPDRVIFKDQETILIDYKTGKQNTQRYTKQLQKYSEALLSMGYSNVKKYLVYVDELSVVLVN